MAAEESSLQYGKTDELYESKRYWSSISAGNQLTWIPDGSKASTLEIYTLYQDRAPVSGKGSINITYEE